MSLALSAAAAPVAAEPWDKKQWTGGDAQRCFKVWNEQKEFCENKDRQGTLGACMRVARQRFVQCCYPKMEGVFGFTDQQLDPRYDYCDAAMTRIARGLVPPAIGAAGEMIQDVIPGQQITRRATIARKLAHEGAKQGADLATPKPPPLTPDGTGAGDGGTATAPNAGPTPAVGESAATDPDCAKCNALVRRWKAAVGELETLRQRERAVKTDRGPLARDAGKAQAALDGTRDAIRRHNTARDAAVQKPETAQVWTARKFKLLDDLEEASNASARLAKALMDLDARIERLSDAVRETQRDADGLRARLDACRRKHCGKKTSAAIPVTGTGQEEPITGLAFRAAPVPPIPDLAPPAVPPDQGDPAADGACEEPDPVPRVRWVCPDCERAAKSVNTHVRIFNQLQSQFAAAACEIQSLKRQVAGLDDTIAYLTGAGRDDAAAKAGSRKAGLQGRLAALDAETRSTANAVVRAMGQLNETRRLLYACETSTECRRWTADIYPKDLSEFDPTGDRTVIALGIPARDDLPLLEVDPNQGTVVPGSGGTGFLPVPDAPRPKDPPKPPYVVAECPACQGAAETVNLLASQRHAIRSRAARARLQAAESKREKVLVYNKWIGVRVASTDDPVLAGARRAHDDAQADLDGKVAKAEAEAAALDAEAKQATARLDAALGALESCNLDRCRRNIQETLRDAIEGRGALRPEPAPEAESTDGLPDGTGDGPSLREKAKAKTQQRLFDAELTKPKPVARTPAATAAEPAPTAQTEVPATATGGAPAPAAGGEPVTGTATPPTATATPATPSTATPLPTFQPPPAETIFEEGSITTETTTVNCSALQNSISQTTGALQQSFIDTFNANCR